MKKLKLLKTQLLIAGLSLLFLFPAVGLAATTDIQNNMCGGANLSLESGGKCKGTTEKAESDINKLISQIVNVLSIIVGIVAVIMIIYGGFRYITSGGESGSVTTAKNTILYAILGLVIVAIAQFIVKFILHKITTK